MNDFMIVVITDALLLAGGFLIPTILLRGFFWTWFKVRTSMGRLVLVEVSEVNRHYFKHGEIAEGFLLYKNSKKEDCKINVPTDVPVLTRKFGVTSVYVDAETGAVMTPELKGVTGFDQVKFEDLYERALYKPDKADPMLKIGMIIAAVAALAAIAAAFFAYQSSESIVILTDQVAALTQKINSGAVIGGKL